MCGNIFDNHHEYTVIGTVYKPTYSDCRSPEIISVMSQATTPENHVQAYQFQFKQPYLMQYPMSQAQQQQLQQQLSQVTAPVAQPQASSSQLQTQSLTPVAGPSNPATPAPSNMSQPLQSMPQNQSQTQAQPSRTAAEQARKDRTLAEFMLMLDDYEPLVRHNSAVPMDTFITSTADPT